MSRSTNLWRIFEGETSFEVGSWWGSRDLGGWWKGWIYEFRSFCIVVCWGV